MSVSKIIFVSLGLIALSLVSTGKVQAQINARNLLRPLTTEERLSTFKGRGQLERIMDNEIREQIDEDLALYNDNDASGTPFRYEPSRYCPNSLPLVYQFLETGNPNALLFFQDALQKLVVNAMDHYVIRQLSGKRSITPLEAELLVSMSERWRGVVHPDFDRPMQQFLFQELYSIRKQLWWTPELLQRVFGRNIDFWMTPGKVSYAIEKEKGDAKNCMQAALTVLHQLDLSQEDIAHYKRAIAEGVVDYATMKSRPSADADTFTSIIDPQAAKVASRLSEVVSAEDERVEEKNLAKMPAKERARYLRARDIARAVRDAIIETRK